ncbi:hypothetical protein HX049_17030 [Myroides odoratimimus]|uniref:hypothetical protein n=1 Tax=Myroides odoratimimus TaxID=76832 RepID=UPI002578646E|nr:hypothetical protein [Myroides odoratimimus]MDM1398849.1 hypothetical protein [Myroides odoratimimus]
MLQDRITQLWVKLFGRRIDIAQMPWIEGVIGDRKIIDKSYIDRLASQYDVIINQAGSGLIEEINILDFTVSERSRLHPQIIDFYTHTSDYDFEVWCEWKGVFKPFGTLLGWLFSKRLQQLNIPTNTISFSKGLESEIIKLQKEEQTVWTIWYRKVKETGQTLFSGIYTHAYLPSKDKELFKVVFPLPNGNATVLLNQEVKEDGSLLLQSNGKQFGDVGFYFYVTNHKGKHWVKFVRSLHESLHIYVDTDGNLCTDHNFSFYTIPFLKLHYKMQRKEE